MTTVEDIAPVIPETCRIDPGAYIGPGVHLGRNVHVGPNAVLGNVGFGYEWDADLERWVQRPHPYGVVVGDGVSIGAGTVIDRGRHRNTTIGSGTKIDANVFIAHNVIIGEDCLIIAGSVICGSAEIEDRCWIGPGTKISDHISVGTFSRTGMGAVVVRNIPAGELWVGNPAKFLRSTLEQT